MPNRVSDGRIPMSDGAGLVESIGDGVTEFKVGDHVVSCFFPYWMEGPPPIADFSTVPGDGVDGYARELVVAPATAFTHAPRGYSYPLYEWSLCKLPTFRDAYRRRRCLVPVDGFFEWKAIKGQKAKQRYAIAMKDWGAIPYSTKLGTSRSARSE